MLKSLDIQNFALIDQLYMQPSSGLNTITGETGAGKSIMLGAIQLLLGQRADSKVLLDESRKCVVEAVFDVKNLNMLDTFTRHDLDYADETIIRREIAPGGKSRAFVNDSPVTLDALKALTLPLLDIHAQHETLSLGSAEAQIKLLDQLLLDATVFEKYRIAYKWWKECESQHRKLIQQRTDSTKDLDYKRFIYQELDEAALDTLNQSELEDTLKVLEHAEQIKVKLNELILLLDQGEFAATSVLANAMQSLQLLQKLSTTYKPLYERMEATWIELRDVCGELEVLESQTEPDQEAMLKIKDRLTLLYRLYQKHGVLSVQSLIDLRESLNKELQQAENIDEYIVAAEQQMQEALEACQKAGKALHEARQQSWIFFQEGINPLFPEVGMPNARMEIQWTLVETPLPHGLDEISILFSANKGISPAPLRQVASGGEFSRLMLCVKFILAQRVAMPTLIFDEIDSGISGEIALKVADLIKKMSGKHQVLSITHLPQMAAAGDAHFFVYKDENKEAAQSTIRLLTSKERLMHIATMIGGANPSESAIQSASELLNRHN